MGPRCGLITVLASCLLLLTSARIPPMMDPAADMCQACLVSVRVLEDFLCDPAATDTLVNFVEKQLCPSMGDQEQCRNLAEGLLPTLIQWFRASATPASLCSSAGVCGAALKDMPQFNKPALRVHDTAECAMCKYVVRQVKVAVNNSETLEKIKEVALQVCSTLPDELANSCTEFVDSYEPMIAELLEDLDPDMVCGLVGVCVEDLTAVPPPPLPAALVRALAASKVFRGPPPPPMVAMMALLGMPAPFSAGAAGVGSQMGPGMMGPGGRGPRILQGGNGGMMGPGSGSGSGRMGDPESMMGPGATGNNMMGPGATGNNMMGPGATNNMMGPGGAGSSMMDGNAQGGWRMDPRSQDSMPRNHMLEDREDAEEEEGDDGEEDPYGPRGWLMMMQPGSGPMGPMANDVCDYCKMAVIEAHSLVSNPAVQAELVNYTKTVCDNFPSFADLCKEYVDTYAPLVFTLLEQYLVPDTLCVQTGMCPPRGLLGLDDQGAGWWRRGGVMCWLMNSPLGGLMRLLGLGRFMPQYPGYMAGGYHMGGGYNGGGYMMNGGGYMGGYNREQGGRNMMWWR